MKGPTKDRKLEPSSGRICNLVVYGIVSSNLGKKLSLYVNSLDHPKEPSPYAVDIDSIVDVRENTTWDSSAADTWLESLKKASKEISASHPPGSTHHATTRHTILGLSAHEISQLVQAIVTPIMSDFAKQFCADVTEIHEKMKFTTKRSWKNLSPYGLKIQK